MSKVTPNITNNKYQGQNSCIPGNPKVVKDLFQEWFDLLENAGYDQEKLNVLRKNIPLSESIPDSSPVINPTKKSSVQLRNKSSEVKSNQGNSKSIKKSEKTLQRETFETSRELEYFSEKELRSQIGHDMNFWPIVLLRELIDNSLDACEKKGITPVIEVEITDNYLSVADNGPGIPLDIIRRSQDYLYRISDKAYYVSPTRGQMGNALKVIYAAPFVIDPSDPEYVEVGSNGELHRISITLDRIAGKPVIKDEVSQFVRNGTFVKVNSTRLISLLESEDSYNSAPSPLELIEGYTAFNPHATFILNGQEYNATDTSWSKWKPSDPTSAHWYNVETISDLVAGYLVKQRANGQHKKTVREFVSEFRGLSSTAKQKLVSGDYWGVDLSAFEKEGDIDRTSLKMLLEKMQAECTAPKPQALGVIGKDHFTKWMLRHGAAEPSVKYIKEQGYDDGLPFVLEVCFGVKSDNTLHSTQIVGLNWSPVIGTMTDATIRQAIQDAAIKKSDPVMFLVHIARPRFEFMDRGKTKIEL